MHAYLARTEVLLLGRRRLLLRSLASPPSVVSGRPALARRLRRRVLVHLLQALHQRVADGGLQVVQVPLHGPQVP